MKTTSNKNTNRNIGALMLAAGFAIMFAMMHHPEGGSNDPAQLATAKWVHGSLIALLIFNTYGLGRLTDILGEQGHDTKLAMLFYHTGLFAFIGATLISGFLQTSLIVSFSAQPDMAHDLSKFAAMLNQALSKLGVISFGAAGLCLAPALIKNKGLTRWVGIIGGVAGLVMVIAILSGVYLSVTTMTAVTALIVIWHAAIGYWLLKN